MKICLVSANKERNPYPVAPLGVLYLAEALRREKHEVMVIDLCVCNNVADAITKSFLKFSPDVIGVSIRNIDNLSYPGIISYLADIKETIDNLRKQSQVPVILGGSAFSIFPEKLLKYLKCDIGVIGEGEKAITELLKAIEAGKKKFSGIDNVIWADGDTFYKNKTSHTGKNNYVINRDLVDNKFYSAAGGMGNLQTKRGCQFDCCYCTYPIIEGKKYRLRDPDIVADEMEKAHKKHRINHFFFVDNIFNFPFEHAKEVCRSVIKKKLSARWSCFANPHNMTEDLLVLMKKAGCENIEFGTDALSVMVLRRLGKSFTMKDVFRTSKLCKKTGIKCAHYVMFGGPGEKLETLQEAFDNIERLECNAVIAMVGIRIYPGTDLEKLSLEEGIITKEKDLLMPHFYLSNKIPLDVLLKKVTNFSRENAKCIVPGIGIKSSDKMYETLRKYYHNGPLWGYLGKA